MELVRAGLAAWLGLGVAQAAEVRTEPLPAPASAAWDAELAEHLRGGFDLDGSGTLDQAEWLAVPCTIWLDADAIVRQVWGSGLATIYGFEDDTVWVGGVWGMPEALRAPMQARLHACGLGPELAPLSAVARIRLLPDGGSDVWDRAVTRILVDAHDLDQSGRIDVPEEVRHIPCPTWQALDRSVRPAWSKGLYLSYGLAPDLLWVGDALGLDVAMRAEVGEAMRRCGVQGSDEEASIPTDVEVVAQALYRLPEAGSPAWTEVVRMTLVRLFDGDGSGALGERAELDAVPCGLWRTLDAALLRDGRRGLIPAYGFGPDQSWRGYALGVQGSARALAADRIAGCLQDAPDPSAAAGAAPELHADPARARAWLTRYDRDGSGMIDTRTEALGVPCGAWRELERAAQRDMGVGVRDLYGLRPGPLWTGDVIGVDARVARLVTRRVAVCTASVREAARGQPR